MKTLHLIPLLLLVVISLPFSAARAERPLENLPEDQLIQVLQSGLEVLSHRLEAARGELQTLESVRRENDHLQARLARMAEDIKRLELHHRQSVEAVLREKKQVEAALRAAEEKGAEAMSKADELRHELRGATERVAQAEQRLIDGLESASPEVRAWLRENLGQLDWPRKEEWQPKPDDEAHKKTVSHALKEMTICDFVDTPLLEALDYWTALHGVEVTLDTGLAAALAKSGRKLVLNGRVESVILAAALQHYLAPLGLTYRVEKDVIKVIPFP